MELFPGFGGKIYAKAPTFVFFLHVGFPVEVPLNTHLLKVKLHLIQQQPVSFPQVCRQLGQTWFILQWICGHHPCCFWKNETGCKDSRYARWLKPWGKFLRVEFWLSEGGAWSPFVSKGWLLLPCRNNSWLQTVQWNYAPAEERNWVISKFCSAIVS